MPKSPQSVFSVQIGHLNFTEEDECATGNNDCSRATEDCREADIIRGYECVCKAGFRKDENGDCVGENICTMAENQRN